MAKAKTPPPVSGGKSATPPASTKPAPAPVAPTANTPSIVAPGLITAAVASTLSLAGLADGIRAADTAYRGIYAAFGIYRYFAEKRLTLEKSKLPISTFLREKCGLSAGTISHTSYAAKAFAWVVTKHITESDYHQMTAGVMRAFIQAMSPESKRRLLPKEAITLLRAGLDSSDPQLEEEFDSLYQHGLTLAEADKAAKQQADAEKKAAAEQKATAQKAAADKAVADALAEKAAAEKAKADKAAAAAKVLADKADIATAAAKTDAEKKAAAKAKADAEKAATAAKTLQDKADDDAAAASAKPTPGKVVQMPAGKPTGTQLGEELDKLFLLVAKADVKDQVAFFVGPFTAAYQLLGDSLKKHLKKSA